MFGYGGISIDVGTGGSVVVSDGDFGVCVDPSGSVDEAALVLLTSGDRRDVDIDGLKQACGRGTCVVMPNRLRDEDLPCRDIEYLGPGDVVDIYGVEVSSLAAEEGLGYRFRLGDRSFYVTGDSGLSESFIQVENTVDMAFVQAGRESVDPDEIVGSAVRMKPSVVVPYLFGGSPVNLENLKADLEDRSVSVRIPDLEES